MEEKFRGTRIVTTVAAIIAWLGLVGGVGSFFIEDIPTLFSLSASVSGLFLVMLVQAMFVLLAIEKNTRPPMTDAEIKAAAANGNVLIN